MFKDLFNLFYPLYCNCCNDTLDKHEKVICTSCLHKLPVNHDFLEKENATTNIFYGRTKIENATSLLLFEKKGPVQNLIHNLKYRGHQEIGTYLGKWLGENLREIEEYQNIEAVIPVPLHKQRLQSRGFNQVEKFGREIADSLNAEYIKNVLIKKTASNTQTYKRRLSRWGTIEETFMIQKQELLQGKHILLVDDLVTTGATIEACCTKLEKIEGVKISIATMAIAG